MENMSNEDPKLPVELIKLRKGKHLDRVTEEFATVFVLKGSLEITYGKMSLVLNKGYAWVVSSGMDLHIYTRQATQLIIVYVHLNGLYEGLPLKLEYYGGKTFMEVKKYTDLLEIKPRIWMFLGTLREYIKAGISSPAFLENKRRELGFLLDACYTKEDLLWFFRTLITSDMEFTALVLARFHDAKDRVELATLCGYSISGFEKHFKKVFGVSPGIWMRIQKNKVLYHTIRYSKQPLKAIAQEYGFLSLSYFNDYCKKHFGDTPSRMRDKL